MHILPKSIWFSTLPRCQVWTPHCIRKLNGPHENQPHRSLRVWNKLCQIIFWIEEKKKTPLHSCLALWTQMKTLAVSTCSQSWLLSWFVLSVLWHQRSTWSSALCSIKKAVTHSGERDPALSDWLWTNLFLVEKGGWSSVSCRACTAKNIHTSELFNLNISPSLIVDSNAELGELTKMRRGCRFKHLSSSLKIWWVCRLLRRVSFCSVRSLQILPALSRHLLCVDSRLGNLRSGIKPTARRN